MDTMQWVERLGGWGAFLVVVTIILKWGFKRLDRLLDQNQKVIDGFQKLITAFQEFAPENQRVHQELVEGVKRIEKKVGSRATN